MSTSEESLDEFWDKAEQVFPGCSSDRYAVPVDRDTYEWFKNLGDDWIVRVNEVLRSHMEANE